MGEVFTLVISLAGVIALILATYFGLKWLNRKVNLSPGSIIRVVERINLGPDKALIIISLGQKYMLLGISQQHVEKICDLDNDEINRIIEDKKEHGREPFAQQLMKAFTAKKSEKGGDTDAKE